MKTKDELEQAERVLIKVLHELSEYFPNVQIGVSCMIGEETFSRNIGRGDWWARRGLTQNFLDMGKAQESAQEIANALKADDEN